MNIYSKLFFVIGLLSAASGFTSPPIALALGLAFGLIFIHPFPKPTKRVTRILLQASVVGLGFGMELHQVIGAGRRGFLYTILSISFAMAAGMAIGRLLQVHPKNAFLISTGTAICGGSAIAAVGPIIEATDEQMSISLGTVFVLNSVALLIFPAIGAALQLTQQQFGLWAALAIHDTSSVVGAAAKYGAAALVLGTTVKLARALWIVPFALGSAIVRRAKARIQWPWFIGLFCLAALCNTSFPVAAPAFAIFARVARMGLTVTLFLIGSGISRTTLRQVGPRPMLLGVILWGIVSLGSLWLIRAGWIGL